MTLAPISAEAVADFIRIFRQAAASPIPFPFAQGLSLHRLWGCEKLAEQFPLHHPDMAFSHVGEREH